MRIFIFLNKYYIIIKSYCIITITKGTINIMIIINIFLNLVAISLLHVNKPLAGLSPAPATRYPIISMLLPFLFPKITTILLTRFLYYLFLGLAIMSFYVLLFTDNLSTISASELSRVTNPLHSSSKLFDFRS